MSDAHPAPFRTVLCAVDFEPGSERELVHVEPGPQTAVESALGGPPDRAVTRRVAVAVDAALGAPGVFDLFGATAHGEAASDAVVPFGSVAEWVVRPAPCPVLAVPAPLVTAEPAP